MVLQTNALWFDLCIDVCIFTRQLQYFQAGKPFNLFEFQWQVNLQLAIIDFVYMPTLVLK